MQTAITSVLFNDDDETIITMKVQGALNPEAQSRLLRALEQHQDIDLQIPEPRIEREYILPFTRTDI